MGTWGAGLRGCAWVHSFPSPGSGGIVRHNAAQSAAQRTNAVIVMSFFMGYSFHLKGAVGVRFLRWLAECRREATHVLQANSRSRSRLNIDPGHGQPVQEMNPA